MEYKKVSIEVDLFFPDNLSNEEVIQQLVDMEAKFITPDGQEIDCENLCWEDDQLYANYPEN